MGRLWVLWKHPVSHELYWRNEGAFKRAYDQGFDIASIRRVLDQESAKETIVLDIIKDDGSYAEDNAKVTDLLLWGLLPVFSLAVRESLLKLGCPTIDLMECRIRQCGDVKFYILVPQKTYGRVIVEESEFLLTIPGSPPKHGLPKVLSVSDIANVPPVFFMSQEDRNLGLTDCMATDSFRLAWNAEKFSGGEFRPLTAIRNTVLG
jgi:hypothetical protein